jgi:nucleoid-associated protein EbfC
VPKQPNQPNMNQILKQAQQMQEEMAKAQEELKSEVVEASAGGGMVTVKVTGDLELREVTIDREAVDPEDVELLQDMVLAAVNEALRSAQELASSRLGAATGGLGGAGGLGDLGGLGGLGS